MKKIRYIFEYYFLLFVLHLFGHLPLRVSAWIWRNIALLLYYAVPSYSQRARNNIENTIGSSWDKNEVEHLIRKSYIYYGNFIAEFCRIPFWGPEILNSITIEGEDHVKAALDKNKGLILVSGHFGNWELMAFTLHHLGYNIHVMYKKLSNPLSDELIKGIRQKFSKKLIEMKKWHEGVAAFEANEILGLVSDQDARKNGIFINFLGKPASTYMGPALLAVRYKTPLIACFIWREEVGKYHLVFEPIDVNQEVSSHKEQIKELTQQWVLKLEHYIRLHPEQYFWFHKRWRTQPPQKS